MKDNTKRFSDRVENYTKYRPSYPREAIEYMFSEFRISSGSVVADVGSGTGILTELLLPRVAAVFAVEPNFEMQEEAVRRLARHPGFHAVNAASESTGIESHTVDFIFAAQAAHWFDLPKTKNEFRRILKPDGHAFLIWNKRRIDTEFHQEYEKLVQSIPGYSEVTHHNLTEDILKEFLGKSFRMERFPNSQEFDFTGLHGRFCSSSYTPKEGTPEYDRLKEKLEDLFNRTSIDGKVRFNYETEVYSGKIE